MIRWLLEGVNGFCVMDFNRKSGVSLFRIFGHDFLYVTAFRVIIATPIYLCFWFFSAKQEGMLDRRYLLLSSFVLESLDFTAGNNLHGFTDQLPQGLCSRLL